MVLILCVHVAVFFAILAAHVYEFRLNLFHPSIVYLVFHFIVFVVRPLFVTWFNFSDIYTYMHYMPTEDVETRTLVATDVGLACFVLSADAISYRRRKLALAWSQAAAASETRQVRRSFALTCLLVGGPVLLSMLFAVTHPVAHAHGGSLNATDMSVDAATGVSTYTNNTGYFADLQTLGGAACLAWAYLKRFRLLHLLPFSLYVLLRATEGGGRFAFLLLSAALGLAFLLYKRRVFPSRQLVLTWIVIGGVLFSLFAAIGNDRKVVRRALGLMDATELSLYNTDSRKRNMMDNSVVENDFANFEYLEYVVHAVPRETNTFSFFRQYLDLFIWPIPRILWSQKPVLGDVNPIKLNDYGNFRALTLSLVGDGWMSLGYFGVIVTLSLAGLVCGSIYNRFARGGYKSPIGGLAYCTFLVLTPQWFRDGGVTIVLFCGEQLAVFGLWALLAQASWSTPDRRTWLTGDGRRQMGGGRFTRTMNALHGWRAYKR